MHNIEKLPGKDYWTGYAPLSGVWRIRKHGKTWTAVCQRTGAWIGAYSARTLKEVSKHLETQ